MRFSVLGPVEVRHEDRVLPLGGVKQRAVLAVLLLRANEIVGRQVLVDELWGEELPERATHSLNVRLSRLRKTLEAAGQESPLLTRPGGYVLRVGPDDLDLHRFERLVEQGRRALRESDAIGASAALREALSLWRGQALSDLRSEPFARVEIDRLEELRVAAIEDRVDADLELGLHAETISELEALVARHPLRERLRSQLMLALYRAGRQAEALEVFQQARRALVEELGIDPGRALRERQQAILRQDAALDLVAAPAVRVERRRSAFVGREPEMELLLNGLDAAVAGHGGLFLLVGEPGIGKSRLADELARDAGDRGARVLVGRCWEGGGAPAYWPWAQQLRSFVANEPEAFRPQVTGRAADSQAVPELRELFPDLPTTTAEDEGARFRLFDAVTGFLRNAAVERPLVLVLDDLQAADEPSLLLLRFLASQLADSRMFVVGTYRDVDPAVRDPLASTLAELSREQVTRRIELRGLTEADVARYIELETDTVPAKELAAAIQAQTEGNPFFVGEVTRLLAGEGELAPGPTRSRIRIPQAVRDVIGRRLRRLPEDTQRMLTFASVLGREFPLDVLALLTELPVSTLLEALDEAMTARILDDVGILGRLGFTHVLIRDALYEDLTPARRLRLHRQAGEAIETLYTDELDFHLSELAYHFAEAAPAGDADKAVRYARWAADRAADLLAFEESVRLFRLALNLTESEDVAGRRRQCELLLAIGDVQARAGDMPAARESFLHAAELAGAIGASTLLARSALGYGGRFVFTRATEDDRIVPLLAQAADALEEEESALRVRVLTRLANALNPHSPESSNALSAEALELARRLNDPATLAYAISGRLWATRAPTDLDERWTFPSALIEAGDKERVFEGHACRCMVLMARGDLVRLRHEHEVMDQLAHELGQPSHHWWIAAHGATLALLEGRFADAEAFTDQARTLGERAQSYDAAAYFQLQRFALRREQGRLAEILTDLEHAAADDPNRPLLRCALAVAYRQLGRAAEAQHIVSQLASHDRDWLPVNNDWLLAMSLLAEHAASTNATQQAKALYRQLAPYYGLNVDTYEVSTGAVARYLGLLARTLERWDDAVSHFEDALALNQSMNALPSLAHTQIDYAQMLRTRDQPGDREKASQLLLRASSTYLQLGMTDCTKTIPKP